MPTMPNTPVTPTTPNPSPPVLGPLPDLGLKFPPSSLLAKGDWVKSTGPRYVSFENIHNIKFKAAPVFTESSDLYLLLVLRSLQDDWLTDGGSGMPQWASVNDAFDWCTTPDHERMWSLLYEWEGPETPALEELCRRFVECHFEHEDECEHDKRTKGVVDEILSELATFKELLRRLDFDNFRPEN